MGNALAVGPGIIGGTGHRCQVGLSLWRFYRGACKLAVGKLNAIVLNGSHHGLQIIIADLVAKPSGTGMNQDKYLPLLFYTESPGYLGLINIIYHLYFQEMVA